MRAFLALPVLPPATEDHARLRARLEAEVAGVRWAPTESPHITLHFFGQIDDHEAQRAIDTVAFVAASHEPLRLHLEGLGEFGDRRRPGVLWWGVKGDVDALGRLARDVREGLASAGFPVETRPFRAHCTLGRPRTRWDAGSNAAWRRAAESDPITSGFDAGHLHIYESVNRGAGTEHVPRATLSLRDGR